MLRQKTLKAFTIVELLIVIVIIGVLAAITTLTYTGIQKRSQDARKISALTQLTKQMAAFAVTQDELPKPSGAPHYWNDYVIYNTLASDQTKITDFQNQTGIKIPLGTAYSFYKSSTFEFATLTARMNYSKSVPKGHNPRNDEIIINSKNNKSCDGVTSYGNWGNPVEPMVTVSANDDYVTGNGLYQKRRNVLCDGEVIGSQLQLFVLYGSGDDIVLYVVPKP